MVLVRICSIKGCQNVHKGRGFCYNHLAKEVFTDSKLCTHGGCNNKHKGRGYCDKHLQRLRKWGDVNFVPDPKIANAKRAEAGKGRVFSKSTRKKMSERIRKSWTPKRRKEASENQTGKKHSEATKKKLSIMNTGKKLPPSTLKKMSIGLSGLKRSPQQRKNISEGRLGMKFSKEHKEKLAIHRSKQKFPRKDTKLEVTAQKILRENNIEFIDHKAILGQPDIFIEPNFCIFLDGDFWHGNPDIFPDDYVLFKEYNGKSGHAPELTAKIKREKDHKINLKLKSQGYHVMRTYETPFYENPKKWLNEVRKFIKKT